MYSVFLHPAEVIIKFREKVVRGQADTVKIKRYAHKFRKNLKLKRFDTKIINSL